MGNASHLVAELALADASKFGFEEQILCTVFLNIRCEHPASYLSERIDTTFGIQTKIMFFMFLSITVCKITAFALNGKEIEPLSIKNIAFSLAITF